MLIEAGEIVSVVLFATGTIAGGASWMVKRTLNGSVARIVEINDDLKVHISETRASFAEARELAARQATRLSLVEQICQFRHKEDA
jgi:hypothetical protein